uniref:translation initiation factor 1 n=1 Tax=Dasymalla teckiana TaxID=2835933 RepID=UPI001D033C73|nr:translation initiation factor 1 [Dasymalla teckiana]QVL24662.1 translation initiation factor 1 [Dasymalla teckiana]
MKEQKWIHEGLVTESHPNGMFRVRLDNEDLVLGYVSGKIRCSSIRILPGDRVKIEVSRYDSTRGRIIYRLEDNDLKDENNDSKDENNDSKDENNDSKDENNDSKD